MMELSDLRVHWLQVPGHRRVPLAYYLDLSRVAGCAVSRTDGTDTIFVQKVVKIETESSSIGIERCKEGCLIDREGVEIDVRQLCNVRN